RERESLNRDAVHEEVGADVPGTLHKVSDRDLARNVPAITAGAGTRPGIERRRASRSGPGIVTITAVSRHGYRCAADVLRLDRAFREIQVLDPSESVFRLEAPGLFDIDHLARQVVVVLDGFVDVVDHEAVRRSEATLDRGAHESLIESDRLTILAEKVLARVVAGRPEAEDALRRLDGRDHDAGGVLEHPGWLEPTETELRPGREVRGRRTELGPRDVVVEAGSHRVPFADPFARVRQVVEIGKPEHVPELVAEDSDRDQAAGSRVGGVLAELFRRGRKRRYRDPVHRECGK